jgi:hypothetical protein
MDENYITQTDITQTDITQTDITQTDITQTDIVDLNTISKISPILEWKKTTELTNYLCIESYNIFIMWLKKNMRGLDKSYSFKKYIKIIS